MWGLVRSSQGTGTLEKSTLFKLEFPTSSLIRPIRRT